MKFVAVLCLNCLVLTVYISINVLQADSIEIKSDVLKGNINDFPNNETSEYSQSSETPIVEYDLNPSPDASQITVLPTKQPLSTTIKLRDFTRRIVPSFASATTDESVVYTDPPSKVQQTTKFSSAEESTNPCSNLYVCGSDPKTSLLAYVDEKVKNQTSPVLLWVLVSILLLIMTAVVLPMLVYLFITRNQASLNEIPMNSSDRELGGKYPLVDIQPADKSKSTNQPSLIKAPKAASIKESPTPLSDVFGIVDAISVNSSIPATSSLMTSLKNSDFEPTKPIEWPHHLRTPTELLHGLRQKTKLQLIRSPIYSKIVLQFVGSWAYLLAHVFNTSRVFNIKTFNKELRYIEDQAVQLELGDENQRRNAISKRAPLLTLSNHISCIDDPILWASLLPLTYYSTRTDSVRWTAAAVEICFSKPWHSTFFSLGKTFPIIRGDGVEQLAMHFASALLKYNQWLHLFPEGRVMRDTKQQKISNKERGYIFKWGISKLILDYFKSSVDNSGSEKYIKILPFYHLGLDEILPISWPYIPRFGKKITIFIRPSVIEMNSKLLSEVLANRSLNSQSNKSKSNDDINRIKLTNYLEEEVEKLIEPTTKLHRLNYCS